MATLRRHWRATALFLVLNGADLALTCHLLRRGDGEVYEANWVAGAVLAEYGLVGLAVFKGAVVLLAVSLVGVVAAYRPRVARRLAGLACVTVGVVVLYSAALWGSLAWQPTVAEELAALERAGNRIDELARKRATFVALVDHWADALAEGRCALREAVFALVHSTHGQDAALLRIYRSSLQAESDVDCVAALVLGKALGILEEGGAPAMYARAEDLLAAYRATYSPALPFNLIHGMESFRDRSASQHRPVAVAGHPAPGHAARPGARTPPGHHHFRTAYTPHEGRDLFACGAVRLVGR